MKLIPMPKNLIVEKGYLATKKINLKTVPISKNLLKALEDFEMCNEGIPLELSYGLEGEGYTLEINEKISIKGDSEKGAFYAIQTLKQLFEMEKVPYVFIKDAPDFPHRGFYHDVTRGKVPTVESIKKLIDKLAYFKINSLQLYVEHTFEFEEYKGVIEKTGYLTAEEMKEIDLYCKERYIDFIPSLSTFGHLYELLEKEEYKHLQVLDDYKKENIRWPERQHHHTIDPQKEESFELIKSLISQFEPNFTSEYFNICCDETFDLKEKDPTGELYVSFLKKLISDVTSKGKKVMMWADIILKYPERIKELPKDIIFLNWNYYGVNEEAFEKLSEAGVTQISCPGTSTWNNFCEGISIEEDNILKMADAAYRHKALGILNTNWGDWGNVCTVELATYGLALGAGVSWNIETKADDHFKDCANALIYKNEKAYDYLCEVSRYQHRLWMNFGTLYSNLKYEKQMEYKDFPEKENCFKIQEHYLSLSKELENYNDEYTKEMYIASLAYLNIIEIMMKYHKLDFERKGNLKKFIKLYSESWLEKNKESELSRIINVFEVLNDKLF